MDDRKPPPQANTPKSGRPISLREARDIALTILADTERRLREERSTDTAENLFLAAATAGKRDVGLELRLHFARLVIRELRRKNWTARNLAEQSALTQAYVESVLHSDVNCTFGGAGRILAALFEDQPTRG